MPRARLRGLVRWCARAWRRGEGWLVAPLIFKRDFTLLRWHVQAAVGVSVQPVAQVEGEVVLDDLPRLRSYRLWEMWQQTLRQRRARWEASQEVDS